MLIQVALNGPLTKDDHPALPVSADELARDATACKAAGAGAVHLHPRDQRGRERLDARVINDVVTRVRHTCGLRVGVSTGAWIEPDLERRLELIAKWRTPDYASVNLSEEGFEEVMAAVAKAGIGIEAGVATVADAERLASLKGSDPFPSIVRVLIEPVDAPADGAVAIVDEIHAALDAGAAASISRLQHGDGEAAWPLIADALARGIDTRVGLEDTQQGPDGQRTEGNEALVRAVSEMLSA
jgi:uncharacterized protein (DUF849 family)